MITKFICRTGYVLADIWCWKTAQTGQSAVSNIIIVLFCNLKYFFHQEVKKACKLIQDRFGVVKVENILIYIKIKNKLKNIPTKLQELFQTVLITALIILKMADQIFLFYERYRLPPKIVLGKSPKIKKRKSMVFDHCIFGKDVSQDYNPFKKLFLSTGWTKVIIFFLSKKLTILRTKFAFKKMHCNALMHHKMHLTDISQSMI